MRHFRPHLLIVACLVMLAGIFSAGCEAANVQPGIDAQREALARFDSETEMIRTASTQPATRPTDPTPAELAAIVQRREAEAAKVRRGIDLAQTYANAAAGAPGADAQVQSTASTLITLIPGAAPFAGPLGILIGGLYGWWQREQKQRQAREFVTSVEILGGPKTDTERALLAKVQSDDTHAVVKRLKPAAKDAVKLLKPAA